MKNITKMFLVLLMIVAAIGITPQARSQTLLLTESFENDGIIPAGWASVIVAGSTKEMAFATADAGGTYTISGIPPGTYTAICSFSPPYFPASAQVTINDNQMTGQNFPLSPAPGFI